MQLLQISERRITGRAADEAVEPCVVYRDECLLALTQSTRLSSSLYLEAVPMPLPLFSGRTIMQVLEEDSTVSRSKRQIWLGDHES